MLELNKKFNVNNGVKENGHDNHISVDSLDEDDGEDEDCKDYTSDDDPQCRNSSPIRSSQEVKMCSDSGLTFHSEEFVHLTSRDGVFWSTSQTATQF
ncbi:hypothetical protein TNIN_201921 [Trichonephila inaurata madagascariensis]|uniref:Uncharacterized protein n=1 Tax=Trichonephila inaurata madagascariensis TaxID=2747483 RepID=A0A8X6WWH0_9ARAC|nr:hypothetical protein TNIN_201921 [Trichonephila inaurata madagascariensis]